MGFASIFHSYVDGVDIGGSVAIIGPGDDKEDIDYFFYRKPRPSLSIVSPTVPHNPDGCAEHINAIMEESPLFRVDTIWATHVLEHSRNPGRFLDVCYESLMPGGNLFISVPPAKHEIVGGHVSLWNLGLLMYHLILAGFDVRNGVYSTQGYNCFANVQKPMVPIQLPDLAHDHPDIDTLAAAGLWPEWLDAHQGFNGNIQCSISHVKELK